MINFKIALKPEEVVFLDEQLTDALPAMFGDRALICDDIIEQLRGLLRRQKPKLGLNELELSLVTDLLHTRRRSAWYEAHNNGDTRPKHQPTRLHDAILSKLLEIELPE